jgi:chemosensory pili system protein ChpC
MNARASKKKTKGKRKTAVQRKSTPRTRGQSRSSGGGKAKRTAVESAVHCTLAPAGAELMLLPTNVIEEIAEYSEPQAMEDMPEWLLGQVEWNNRQVPVFSYPALIHGDEPEEVTSKSRIMMIKSLSDSARVPYLGILLSDIPSLDHITRDDLFVLGDDKKALGVFRRVSLREQEAVIPDLDRLTHLVTHAAYGALPITQLDA